MVERTRPGRRGFSLVELLVVLCIIAVLIAILLPSLSRARSQANRTRCLSNIRQLGYAVELYVHDYGDLPPLVPISEYLPTAIVYTPVYYATPRSGLMILRSQAGFTASSLVCPEGWASGGDSSWYESRGLSRSGSAYMDYAYWGGRFAPLDNDVRYSSFKYRVSERGTKILITDVVTELSDNGKTAGTIGYGNHSSSHAGRQYTNRLTDPYAAVAPAGSVTFRAEGCSALFSDYHADWFSADRLTQQTAGLVYPPKGQGW